MLRLAAARRGPGLESARRGSRRRWRGRRRRMMLLLVKAFQGLMNRAKKDVDISTIQLDYICKEILTLSHKLT
ncbi:MAG: hypothetical protein INR71_08080 [Terriglobus roseus]|nr:hypothetical protein [Terriglobus roseus]